MHTKRYLATAILAMLALLVGACDVINPPQPTPIPYEQVDAQEVLNAFARAGLPVDNPTQERLAPRGAPSEFRDRWFFEIPSVAPAGGQIVIFASQEQADAWVEYIERLRNDSLTRRDVVYTYFHENAMLQLNTMLSNADAARYRDAFMGITT